MTTLVGDDPETGTEETHPDRDRGVDNGSGDLVGGVGEVPGGSRQAEGSVKVFGRARGRLQIDTHKEARKGSVLKDAQTKHPMAIKSCTMYWELLIADLS